MYHDSGHTRPPTNWELFKHFLFELGMALRDVKDWILDWLKDCCTPPSKR
jgi:hypothetical protein